MVLNSWTKYELLWEKKFMIMEKKSMDYFPLFFLYFFFSSSSINSFNIPDVFINVLQLLKAELKLKFLLIGNF